MKTPKATRPTRIVKPGDIVNYVLSSGRGKGEIRPAIIVRLWGEATADSTPAAQLQVFTDGTNDFDHGQPGSLTGLLWATSVSHDEAEKKPGTWHWPEAVEGEA
ncbi:MAG TPA: hypothetical protein VHE33_06040 [Acidobacteriaceae bacterium]|nr:hypothetical protein [Acidobacteriaceae bacterium]HVU67536.1 hypothetical protein [Ktedonobacteraceae bacterium]